MTGPIGNVGGPNPTPTPQPRPQLDATTLAELQAKGINPNDASQMTPENLQAKGVNPTIIAAIFPPQQSNPAAETAVVTTGGQLTEDKVQITKKEPTEADQLRREGEKYRKQINQDFVNDAKDYSQKDAAFRAKQEEVNALRERLNEVSKKTMKKEIEVLQPDGTTVKMDKFKAREEAQAALDKAEAELVALGKERKAIKERLEQKQQLSAANQFNVENAEEADKKRATRRDVDDYLTSDEGRKAVKDNLITTADGTPLVDKDGKPFKRGSDERAAAYDAIQAEYEASGNPISRKGARRIYKARTKDYSSMEKEDALEKIIIGDKDAYKAETKKDGFDEDMPSVTFMSEELYEKAQKFAKARGVELPSLEEAKANGLTGKQLEEFQQLLMDEAGDVGSRLDAKERKALDKEFKDISYGDFRKMFDAGNVDVQKTYDTAAAVAGVAASAATGAILGLTTPGTEGIDDIIVDIPTYVGGEHTGHFETVQEIIPGTPGSAAKFNWLHAGIAAGVGPAVAMGIKAIANYDPNGFHKGVTLEQFVYNEMDKNEAFKKLAPNVKATMAKVIAENPNMSKDEIFAACDRALGDANERINLRESVGADASLRALSKRKRQEIPQDELKPELEEAVVWDINQGDLASIDGATLVQDGRVTDTKVEENLADGLAYDAKIVNKDKRNTATTFDQAQTRGDDGRLVNQNRINARSQYVIADEKGETKVTIGNGTPEAPESYIFTDNSNGPDHKNTYEYKKLSDADAQAKGLDPKAGPFYELVSAKKPDGSPITQTKGKVFKLNFSSTDRTAYKNEVDDDGYTTKRVKYTVRTPHYEMNAVDNLGRSSSQYPKTGAQPN